MVFTMTDNKRTQKLSDASVNYVVAERDIDRARRTLRDACLGHVTFSDEQNGLDIEWDIETPGLLGLMAADAVRFGKRSAFEGQIARSIQALLESVGFSGVYVDVEIDCENVGEWKAIVLFDS